MTKSNSAAPKGLYGTKRTMQCTIYGGASGAVSVDNEWTICGGATGPVFWQRNVRVSGETLEGEDHRRSMAKIRGNVRGAVTD